MILTAAALLALSGRQTVRCDNAKLSFVDGADAVVYAGICKP
jgi:hypothetical protein